MQLVFTFVPIAEIVDGDADPTEGWFFVPFDDQTRMWLLAAALYPVVAAIAIRDDVPRSKPRWIKKDNDDESAGRSPENPEGDEPHNRSLRGRDRAPRTRDQNL